MYSKHQERRKHAHREKEAIDREAVYCILKKLLGDIMTPRVDLRFQPGSSPHESQTCLFIDDYKAIPRDFAPC